MPALRRRARAAGRSGRLLRHEARGPHHGRRHAPRPARAAPSPPAHPGGAGPGPAALPPMAGAPAAASRTIVGMPAAIFGAAPAPARADRACRGHARRRDPGCQWPPGARLDPPAAAAAPLHAAPGELPPLDHTVPIAPGLGAARSVLRPPCRARWSASPGRACAARAWPPGPTSPRLDRATSRLESSAPRSRRRASAPLPLLEPGAHAPSSPEAPPRRRRTRASAPARVAPGRRRRRRGRRARARRGACSRCLWPSAPPVTARARADAERPRGHRAPVRQLS